MILLNISVMIFNGFNHQHFQNSSLDILLKYSSSLASERNVHMCALGGKIFTIILLGKRKDAYVACFLLFSFSIKGSTAVEIASGLHWYIKYWCEAHISWDKTGGIQIASVPNPGSLPLIKDEGVMIHRPVPWNYYQNVVTASCKYQVPIPLLLCAFHHSFSQLLPMSTTKLL